MYKILYSVLAVAFIVSTSTSFAKPEAKPSDERLTWDLTEIYKTPADWDKARKEVLEEIKKIEKRMPLLSCRSVININLYSTH